MNLVEIVNHYVDCVGTLNESERSALATAKLNQLRWTLIFAVSECSPPTFNSIRSTEWNVYGRFIDRQLYIHLTKKAIPCIVNVQYRLPTDLHQMAHLIASH